MLSFIAVAEWLHCFGCVDIRSVDTMSVDTMSVDTMSVDMMSVDIPSVDMMSVDIPSVDTMSVVLPYVVGSSHEEANNENKIIRMLKITSASDQDF
jgi:pentapeptide MXKDX repeat protein